MEKRTLNHCKRQKIQNKATVAHLNDQLTTLPDEILLKIWSHLTTKEAARANLVSRMSKTMWLVHPSLDFEDKNVYSRLRMNRMNYDKLILQERSTFIDRVDYIVKHHQGLVVDEFRIAFDLCPENRSHIDNWLVFAFSKQVKRLELDLTRGRSSLPLYELKMPVEYQVSSSVGTFKSSLTSLCLVCVHLTSEVIESFLNSFPSLEILCIRRIHTFTSIKASSSLALKHLEVAHNDILDSVDIFVPHLLSFTCEARLTTLHLRNASLLSVMTIGSFNFNHRIAYTLDCLLFYCAQLEYLEVKINLFQKHNLQFNQCPTFPNVKHLELNFAIPPTSTKDGSPGGWMINENISILGWTPVIKAFPGLQKLTLNLESQLPYKNGVPMRKIKKLDAHPLSSLKTLEIVGFLGHCASLELVMFVMENADMLEEMIVEALSPCVRKGSHSSGVGVRTPDPESHKLALELLERHPQNVKLIFRDKPSYSS